MELDDKFERLMSWTSICESWNDRYNRDITRWGVNEMKKLLDIIEVIVLVMVVGYGESELLKEV